MGAVCSCHNDGSWRCLKWRLQMATEQRRRMRYCICTWRRPRFLMIRRRKQRCNKNVCSCGRVLRYNSPNVPCRQCEYYIEDPNINKCQMFELKSASNCRKSGIQNTPSTSKCLLCAQEISFRDAGTNINLSLSPSNTCKFITPKDKNRCVKCRDQVKSPRSPCKVRIKESTSKICLKKDACTMSNFNIPGQDVRANSPRSLCVRQKSCGEKVPSSCNTSRSNSPTSAKNLCRFTVDAYFT